MLLSYICILLGVVNAEGVHTTTVKEGQLYETVTLKWCTPRSSSVGKYYELTFIAYNFFNILHFKVILVVVVIKVHFFKYFTELQYCTSAFRITPVDVNNRPSSCLTNFLLNGNFHGIILSAFSYSIYF